MCALSFSFFHIKLLTVLLFLKKKPGHSLAWVFTLCATYFISLSCFIFVLQGINGILADEMGLGKTVQSIAFLSYLAEVCF